MKRLSNVEIGLIFFLICLSAYLWKLIPSIQLVGEGYSPFLIPTFSFDPSNFFRVIELLQRIMFELLTPVFKGEIYLYMWIVYIVMLLTNIIFYILVKTITRNTLISFIATLIYSLSAIGKYDMLASGIYPYFSQRAIVLPFQLIALTLFILYFKTGRIRYYLISLLLYLFAVTMGMFGTWFIAPFLFYPIFHYIFNTKHTIINMIKTIWSLIPFPIGNILIIYQNGFTSSSGFASAPAFKDWLFSTNLFYFIWHQLTIVTLPPLSYHNIIILVSNLTERLNLEVEPIGIVGPVVTVVYLLTLYFISIRQPKLKAIAFTAFFALILMLLLNYKHPDAVLRTAESSRYFYFPYTMLALFWGIFIYTVLPKNILKVGAFLIIFTSFWTISNLYAIEKMYERNKAPQIANKSALNKIEKMQSLQEPRTTLVVPFVLGTYAAEYIKRFYLHPSSEIIVTGFQDTSLQSFAQKGINPDKFFFLDYDTQREVMADKTQESRNEIREIQKKLKINPD